MLPQAESTEMEQAAVEIVAKLARKQAADIGLEDSLLDDLHLDSLHVLELLTMLEQRFGFETEPEDLQPELFLNVRSIARFVQSKVG